MKKGLGIGLAIWMGTGCVIPQEDQYLVDVPIVRNRPPRIVENQVQPSERIIRGYGTDLCELEFSIIVEDPDVGNTLYAKWYVDYDPAHPRTDAEETLMPQLDQKAVRDERLVFHPTINSADFNRLNTPGDHVVEVLIADSALQGRDPQPTIIRLQDGTYFNDPGYSVSYVWFVRTEAGGNCP